MGHNRRWRSVNDAARYDADIVIVCRGCEHTVVIERETFLRILSARRINSELSVVAGRLRCHRCPGRDFIIDMTAEGDPRTLALRPTDPLPPRGAPLCDWLMWTHTQRELFMRRQRRRR